MNPYQQPQPQQSQDDKAGTIVIGPVVLSYPNLFVPRENKDDDGNIKKSYDSEFLIYDDNPQQQALLGVIMQAIYLIAQEMWKGNWQHQLTRLMSTDKAPVRRISMGKSFRPGEDKDGWRIKGKSGKAIPVAKKDPNSPPGRPILIPVTDADEAYPGVQVAAQLKAHSYNHPKGGEGISWWLNQLVLIADGPRLGQTVEPAEQAFAGFNFDMYPGLASKGQDVMNSMMPGMPMPGMQPQIPQAMPMMGMPGGMPQPMQNVSIPTQQGMIGMPQQPMAPVQSMPMLGAPPQQPMPGMMPQMGMPMPPQQPMAPQGYPGLPQQTPGIQIPGMPGIPY